MKQQPRVTDVKEWRNALVGLSAVQAQENLTSPNLSQIVVPTAHWQALALDTTVIKGIRGAGKSFWTAVLYNDETRRFVAEQINSKELKETIVKIGFSVDLTGNHHPSPTELARLTRNYSNCQIWKAIIYRHLAKTIDKNSEKTTDWSKTVKQFGDDILFEKGIAKYDSFLNQNKQTILIVFDALDRLAKDWDDVRKWVQSLLEIALELRSCSNVRIKLFFRPDMTEDETIWQFQDSSKLRHSAVELKWQPADLFSIIIRYISNHPSAGNSFRSYCTKETLKDYKKVENIFIENNDPGEIRKNTEIITGEWMGNGPKRGFCFSWIPVHLADARSDVAPRSLLLAMKTAAEETINKYSTHNLPVHFEAIKKGVAKASEVRVYELNEDYPWITPLLNTLGGQIVPLDNISLQRLWKNVTADILNSDKLPPRRFSSESDNNKKIHALLEDLEELGVVYKTTDKRINIPDIYRVGFKIGRKGGVRPIKS